MFGKKTGKLSGTRVAILATDGFEQSELFEPRKALENAGAEVHIISIKTGAIKSWHKDNWGEAIEVNYLVGEVSSSNYDCLMIPGGVINPDRLRADQEAVEFVSEFLKDAKPVAAICHGPQLLIETRLLRGRKLTSYNSIKTDLQNAGAKWVDEEVVTDMGLVTSRQPSDIPAFNKKMIEEFAEGVHSEFSNSKGDPATPTP